MSDLNGMNRERWKGLSDAEREHLSRILYGVVFVHAEYGVLFPPDVHPVPDTPTQEEQP